MRDAKIGWWQADRNRRVFHISEGLRDLLGVASCEVTYEEFGKMITPAYREYALASIGVRGGAERLYPLQGAEGEIWCYWKLLREEVADDGGMLLTGYFRVVDPPSEVVNSQEKQRINDLLFRLNSISQTLLSLLKVDDLDAVVNKILADVLTMFDGGRAYIIESDPEHRLYNCTYEVTAENVAGEQELVSGISMDEVPWWTQPPASTSRCSPAPTRSPTLTARCRICTIASRPRSERHGFCKRIKRNGFALRSRSFYVSSFSIHASSFGPVGFTLRFFLPPAPFPARWKAGRGRRSA